MTTETIPAHILATLRRATREVEDLQLQAKTIERFAQAEVEPLALKSGDVVNLDSGTIARAESAPE